MTLFKSANPFSNDGRERALCVICGELYSYHLMQARKRPGTTDETLRHCRPSPLTALLDITELLDALD